MRTDTSYEFRDYTLRPGTRDAMIELFESTFVGPLEAFGAHVRAIFRDLDNPDRFVWIRSFADARTRFAALDGFYTSDVWRAHRDAANAMIVDSDNVIQLRPVVGDIDSATPDQSSGIIVSSAYFLAPHAEADFIPAFARDIAPTLGPATPFATFVTDHAPNAYPRLPVRENETVFLTLTRVSENDSPKWKNVDAHVAPLLSAPIERRRLGPTARSALR